MLGLRGGSLGSVGNGGGSWAHSERLLSGWAAAHLQGVLDAASVLSANFPKVRLSFDLNFFHQSVEYDRL